jgi:hypothetical protein
VDKVSIFLMNADFCRFLNQILIFLLIMSGAYPAPGEEKKCENNQTRLFYPILFPLFFPRASISSLRHENESAFFF